MGLHPAGDAGAVTDLQGPPLAPLIAVVLVDIRA